MTLFVVRIGRHYLAGSRPDPLASSHQDLVNRVHWLYASASFRNEKAPRMRG